MCVHQGWVLLGWTAQLGADGALLFLFCSLKRKRVGKKLADSKLLATGLECFALQQYGQGSYRAQTCVRLFVLSLCCYHHILTDCRTAFLLLLLLWQHGHDKCEVHLRLLFSWCYFAGVHRIWNLLQCHWYVVNIREVRMTSKFMNDSEGWKCFNILHWSVIKNHAWPAKCTRVDYVAVPFLTICWLNKRSFQINGKSDSIIE